MGNLLLFSQKRHKPIKFERNFRLLKCNFYSNFAYFRKKDSNYEIRCCPFASAIVDTVDAFDTLRQIMKLEETKILRQFPALAFRL